MRLRPTAGRPCKKPVRLQRPVPVTGIPHVMGLSPRGRDAARLARVPWIVGLASDDPRVIEAQKGFPRRRFSGPRCRNPDGLAKGPERLPLNRGGHVTSVPVARTARQSTASRRKWQPGLFPDGFDSSGKARVGILLFLVLLVLLAAAASLLIGAYEVRPSAALSILASHLNPFGAAPASFDRLQETIVWDLRAPRILLAILVGMALGASGAVFQGCFRNPLVEPYILGVSSGAAFGAALGILFPWFALSVQVSSFVFGFLAVLITVGLARVRGETPALTLILAGVIVGSVFAALVSILKYVATETSLREIVFWLMGGFYFATWEDAGILALVVLPGFAAVWLLGWKLNILSMGDDEARSLGVHPEVTRFVLVLLATLITSVAVSAVGVIVWVGLMMPHAARLVLGADHRGLIPGAAAMGAVYLLACDTLARTLTDAEIPIGILTSLIGAPYLFFLLRTRGREVLG